MVEAGRQKKESSHVQGDWLNCSLSLSAPTTSLDFLYTFEVKVWLESEYVFGNRKRKLIVRQVNFVSKREREREWEWKRWKKTFFILLFFLAYACLLNFFSSNIIIIIIMGISTDRVKWIRVWYGSLFWWIKRRVWSNPKWNETIIAWREAKIDFYFPSTWPTLNAVCT